MTTHTAQATARAINVASAAPDWIELLPAAQIVSGRDGRSWVNSKPDAVVTAFESDLADLPVDIEHSTEHKAPKGDPAPAVGWIKEMQSRDDHSIWGRVEWTDEGRRLVANRGYRYISPVFSHEKGTGNIIQIHSAGLTNQPNLHLTALNQRNNSTHEDCPVSNVALAINTALGLPADSAEPTVVQAINQLQTDLKDSKNPPPLDEFVPAADHKLALERAQAAEASLAEVQKQQADAEIEEALNAAITSGKISPATKEYHRASCSQEGGLERFKGFVVAAPTIAADDINLNAAPAGGTPTLSESDKAVCQMMGLDESEFSKAKEAK